MNWTLATTLAMGLSGHPLPPEPEAVMQLPPAVIEQLDERVKRRSPRADRRLDLLVDFMFAKDGLGLKYQNAPTSNVADTIESRRSNCLSFTMLFLAMAEHVGINASPREVQVPISWRRDGASLYESGHVNVYVITEKRRAIVDFEPDPILSHRFAVTQRGRRINRERILAHYYNNRSAELLGDDQLDLARHWSEVALAMAPDFRAALNNRGVLESRAGFHELAETLFLRVLELDPDDINALFNLHMLYRRIGQRDAAEQILDRLGNLRTRDPYVHWSLAQNLENVGELDRAESLYRRAVRLKNDEPLFHAGLARVAYAKGQLERAERSLVTAMKLSNRNPMLAFEWDESLLYLKSRMSSSP